MFDSHLPSANFGLPSNEFFLKRVLPFTEAQLNQPGSGPSPSQGSNKTPETVARLLDDDDNVDKVVDDDNVDKVDDDDNVDKDRPQNTAPKGKDNEHVDLAENPSKDNRSSPHHANIKAGEQRPALNLSSNLDANIEFGDRSTLDPSSQQPANIVHFDSFEQAAGFTFGTYTSLFTAAKPRHKRYRLQLILLMYK